MARRDDFYRITDARPPLSADLGSRTRVYLWSMGIRTLCFLGAVVASFIFHWVIVGLILMIGAITLPYIAVVMANAGHKNGDPQPLPPLIIADTASLPPGHPDRTNPTS